MTRYFFHLHNDSETRDEEGTEFPSLQAALFYAEGEVAYQAAESVREHRHLVLGHSLVICDEGGEVATVRFGDVIEVVG